MKEIEQVYKTNKDKGIEIKCLTVINPGNPTGNVLSYDDIKDCLQFCKDNNLIYSSDEVYQENI